MLRQVLEEFLAIDGVISAAVVGYDGFVIESATTGSVDVDGLGAISSSAMRFYERGGESMHLGAPRQLVLEYSDGVLLLAPVTRDEFLAVLTDTRTIPGKLARFLGKTGPRLAAAM